MEKRVQPSFDGNEDNMARAKRDSFFLSAHFCREAGESLGVARVRNLSETGLMAQCEVPLADGDRLVVDLRGIGPVAGWVTWVRGDRIGMAFDQKIEPQRARKSHESDGTADLPMYLRPIKAVNRFSS